MNILSIDTSSSSMSVCIASEDTILGEINLNNGFVHSTTLMPCIEKLFDILDFDKKSLDLLVVCVGPGSFTGIRIGVSTANAISFALDIPVISVGSLEALANNFLYFDGTIISAFNAQRDNYYVGVYKNEEGVISPILDDSIMSDEALSEYILSLEGKVLVCGDCLEDIKDVLGDKTTVNSNVIFADFANNFIKSSNLAVIGAKKHTHTDNTSLKNDFAVPVYMRKSQAEIAYDEKHKGI